MGLLSGYIHGYKELEIRSEDLQTYIEYGKQRNMENREKNIRGIQKKVKKLSMSISSIPEGEKREQSRSNTQRDNNGYFHRECLPWCLDLFMCSVNVSFSYCPYYYFARFCSYGRFVLLAILPESKSARPFVQQRSLQSPRVFCLH